MFVFRRKDLPPDPIFHADLEKLGYFINDNDQIRKISDPEQEFQFKINRNDRWNYLNREAMHSCIRSIVLSRLHSLGLSTLQLPLTAGPEEPHVPILVSSNLSSAKRVIVVFGEPCQDLGIWAYRTIGKDGIDAGSAVAFAKAVLGRDKGTETGSEEKTDTALVIANCGQLIWHCGSRRAITHPSWLALPRESAVDPPLRMTHRNKIPRNKDWQEHVECVFEEILAARGRFLREDAKIDIIGLVEGGLGAVRYLAKNWQNWRSYISAICLSNPIHYKHLDLSPIPAPSEDGSDSSGPSSFTAFMSSRCRAYILSEQPLEHPVPGSRIHGCNCYSSGEALNVECIMPSAWKSMLEWLEQCYEDPTYGEIELVVGEDAADLGLATGESKEDSKS
ncbi:Arb2 domain-containing protein [Thermoascus aurantiacus ATCC 26904]